MTKVDQFESVFRAADKAVYEYGRIDVKRVQVVSDLEGQAGAALVDQIRAFLSVIDEDVEWSRLDGDAFDSVRSLLDHVEHEKPDLIVTYRHLHSRAWHWPHSLGEYLDVLTQATDIPIIVLPHPDANYGLPHSVKNTNRVMAITDHLTGDARLVNYAVRFTEPHGTCWLTHIEGHQSFDHFINAISKISEIDTDIACQAIEEQLFKEPRDYIRSCRDVLEAAGLTITIEKLVTMGRRLAEYQRLVEEHKIDLLVLNTMDEDQLAMHGLAYPLAVELRQIPLLML